MALSSNNPALIAGTALLVAVLAAGPADAKVFQSRSEALEDAFPGADRVEKRTFILTSSQAREVEELARCELDTKLITLYTGWQGDRLLGYAHIDVHTVRTQPEALMVVLTAEGIVGSLRVVAFHEPLDYLPTKRWYRQFEGRSEIGELRLGRDVHGVIGATVSARAATQSVRRMLAYHAVLIGDEPEPTRSEAARTNPTDPKELK